MTKMLVFTFLKKGEYLVLTAAGPSSLSLSTSSVFTIHRTSPISSFLQLTIESNEDDCETIEAQYLKNPSLYLLPSCDHMITSVQEDIAKDSSDIELRLFRNHPHSIQ